MKNSKSGSELLRERIENRLADISPAEQRVAEYFRDHTQEVIFATAGEIGATTGTSDATVVRAAKALGYSGLPELKRDLGQQALGRARPSVKLTHRIDKAEQETSSLLDHVFTEAAERLAETRRLVSEADFVRAVDLVAGAREVVAYGIGPSESSAYYLHLRLRRLGRQSRLVSTTGFRLADDLIGLRENDAVVLYAPGRMINDIDVLLDHARSVGCPVVLFSDSLAPALLNRVAVNMTAVHSGSGYSAEGLSSLLLTDCLTLGVAARDRDRSVGSSELLNSLRSNLTAPEKRGRAPRRSRSPEKGPQP